MVTFLIALLALILGYVLYSRVVDHIFHPTDKPTPATIHNDGVDYIPLPTWKVFLIQLLNIAGLGPIVGALGGALWGPSVYLWIVLGTIFAGGVHDYMSGMISLREDGKSISEVVGNHMGSTMLMIMRVFSVILLILVGTVFMTGPAMLLSKLTGWAVSPWLLIILLYFFIATLLPIDTIIARFYPLFGICLIVMALGIMGGMLLGVGGHEMPELVLQNLHPAGPDKMPIWPLMFITVACGAVSGFHSTQSPIMARCLKKESLARPVFYGAMVAEGIIALIWAAAGGPFYDGTGGLQAAMKAGGPGGAVYDICIGFMGAGAGAVLAMLGVIFCPITSGDTAFRSARLTLSDWFNIPQVKAGKRLMLAVPILGIGAILSQIDFTIVWRYFSWTNQTLAMIVLWTGAVYIYRTFKGKGWLVAAIPATFMSAVTTTYILQAPEGFQLPTSITYPVGIVFGILFLLLYLRVTVMRGPAGQGKQEG